MHYWKAKRTSLPSAGSKDSRFFRGRPVSRWLTSLELSQVARIDKATTSRILRRSLEGHSWRKTKLNVIVRGGCRGRGGLSYTVALDSLPADLQAKYRAENPVPPALPVPALPAPELAVSCRFPRPTDISSRLAAIRPALAYPPRSAGRALAVRTSAKEFGCSEDSIYKWLRDHETGDLPALGRKTRSDKGKKAVLVSRRWDRTVPFDDERKAAIAGELLNHARALWANGVPGRKHGALIATAWLVMRTRQEGFDLPNAEMLKVCAVPRAFVARERSYRRHAVKAKDAKRHDDLHKARGIRKPPEHPMDVVVADVHHFKILFPRPDGTMCTPKLIGWLDMATKRLFASFVFLDPGQGIRQEHIARSFIEMTQHPHWGMPQTLYIDNGGEFNKMDLIDDAMKLAWRNFQESRGGVQAGRPAHLPNIIRALPHNAAAKPIEGIFGVLQRGAFAMIPGWFGAILDRKKTANVGRPPTPFKGDHNDFRDTLRRMLDYYETIEQFGALKGRSPRMAFNAAVEAGWRRTDMARDALLFTFATERVCTVKHGNIKIGDTHYGHDALLMESTNKVRVRVPVIDAHEGIYVYDRDNKALCFAEPLTRYGYLDVAGAKDVGRRQTKQNRMYAEQRAEFGDVDLAAGAMAYADLHPPALTPESGATIRLREENEEALRMKRDAERAPVETERQRRDRQTALLNQTTALLAKAKAG